jgi:hypothetical protein
MSRRFHVALPILVLVPVAVLVPLLGSREAIASEEVQEDLDQAELEELTRTIAKDIERLRGESFLHPVEVSIAGSEDFRRYALERMEHTTSEEELAAEEIAGKLLGLLPPEMDLLETQLEVLEEQVSGFYDPATKSFCLMAGTSGPAAKVTLAHELTHALDDQHHDIDSRVDRLKGNVDALTAYWAVVEGSGLSLMNQWVADALLEKRISWQDLQDIPGLESGAMAKAPEYIWKPLLFCYVRGATFLVNEGSLLGAAGKFPSAEDVRRSFETPPRSTEQVLHPEKYWDPESRDEPRDLGFHVDLDAGWSVVHENTLGELGLALFATPPDERRGVDLSNADAIPLIAYTSTAAAGWGGDRYVLLGRAEARVLHLVTLWDTATDAAEFFAAAEALRPHLEEANLRLCQQAEKRGESGCRSGARIRRGAEDEVVVTAWIGVGAQDLERLLEGVSWFEGQ